MELDEFQVLEVAGEYLVVQKTSSGHRIAIPLSRITDVRDLGNFDRPMLRLDGRLQRVTSEDAWRFFEDIPSPHDVYGFLKPSNINDPRVTTVAAKLQSKYTLRWALESWLPNIVSAGGEIVYDSDGKFFRIVEGSRSLILVAVSK